MNTDKFNKLINPRAIRIARRAANAGYFISETIGAHTWSLGLYCIWQALLVLEEAFPVIKAPKGPNSPTNDGPKRSVRVSVTRKRQSKTPSN